MVHNHLLDSFLKMIPLEMLWKWLWTNFKPSGDVNVGIAKEEVIQELLAAKSVTKTNKSAQQIAQIFVPKCIPALWPSEPLIKTGSFINEAKSIYCLQRLNKEEAEANTKSVPPLPQQLRNILLKSVRDEIMGRRSAQSLLSLSSSRSNSMKRSLSTTGTKDTEGTRSTKRAKTMSVAQAKDLSLPIPSSASFSTPTPMRANTIEVGPISSPINNSSSSVPLPPTTPSPSKTNSTLPSDVNSSNNTILSQRLEIEQLRSAVLLLQREVEQLKQVVKRKDRTSQIGLLNMHSELNLVKAQLADMQQKFTKFQQSTPKMTRTRSSKRASTQSTSPAKSSTTATTNLASANTSNKTNVASNEPTLNTTVSPPKTITTATTSSPGMSPTTSTGAASAVIT